MIMMMVLETRAATVAAATSRGKSHGAWESNGEPETDYGTRIITAVVTAASAGRYK